MEQPPMPLEVLKGDVHHQFGGRDAQVNWLLALLEHVALQDRRIRALEEKLAPGAVV